MSVECGRNHSLAITEAGRIYSWGCGGHGRLGHNNRESQSTPKLIEALQGVTVASAAAGALHSLAVTDAGQVYSWGFRGVWPSWPRQRDGIRSAHAQAH